jgi:ubiquitin carboxyl-terminal hydrolase 7
LYEILVPKNGTVADAIEILQRKAGIPDDVVSRIRFYETHNFKVFRECPINYPVTSFQEYIGLYAEPTPEEEMDPGEGEVLGTAFHFDKETGKAHGHPFIFLIKEVQWSASFNLSTTDRS